MNQHGMSRIEELRRKKGYTQIKVQMLTGIDQSEYSKIERGVRDPSFWQCIALAIAFNTSMDYIAGLTDNPRPYPRSQSYAARQNR